MFELLLQTLLHSGRGTAAVVLKFSINSRILHPGHSNSDLTVPNMYCLSDLFQNLAKLKLLSKKIKF